MTSPLSPRHRAQLVASSICEEVIEARGYRTAEKQADLKRLGFTERQRNPGLLIPLFDVHGDPAGYQLRPDSPRFNGTGKPVKYETPGGTTSILDFHPFAQPMLDDPQIPIFFSEGVKKADSAVSRDLCCGAVIGLWNWRGTNEKGGRTALPDFESIALNGRRVYLVPDSDALSRYDLYAAVARWKALLESRHGEVFVVILPRGKGGAKVGMDDFFAAGKSVADLLALATATLPQPPRGEGERAASLPYRRTPQGYIHDRHGPDGITIPTPLTNYDAQIVGDVLRDDGSGEPSHFFEIEAALNGRPARFMVTAREFPLMAWAPEHLGAEAATYPGISAKDHARFAMQVLSAPIPRRTIYTHTGWRKIGERWAFLHVGGAIGADAVEVDPPRGLERYLLPAVPSRQARKEAVRRALEFLKVAPLAQTWPLLAAMYGAPLFDVLPMDFTIWVHGPTQQQKSTVIALALCHFGDFDRNHLPGNFLSSANAVELQLFHAKDVPFVVDDYTPAPDGKTAAAQESVAYRLIRGTGDTRGRAREGGREPAR